MDKARWGELDRLSGRQSSASSDSIAQMNTAGCVYRGYRFPPEIIRHCVVVLSIFRQLSQCRGTTVMAEHGVTVTYETVRA